MGFTSKSQIAIDTYRLTYEIEFMVSLFEQTIF